MKCEVYASEYCDDAPDSIEIDETQFDKIRDKIINALKGTGFNYACKWLTDSKFTAFDKKGVEITDDNWPNGYQERLKIYADGSIRIFWQHKHNELQEFWIHPVNSF